MILAIRDFLSTEIDERTWRQRTITAIRTEYSSYELEGVSLRPAARDLLTRLYDLGWLVPAFNQRAARGRIIYSFRLTPEAKSMIAILQGSVSIENLLDRAKAEELFASAL